MQAAGAVVVVCLAVLVALAVVTRTAWKRLLADTAEEMYLGRPFIGVPPEVRDPR